MKTIVQRCFLGVLSYALTANIALAAMSPCETTRSDIAEIQRNVRNAEVQISENGFKRISDLAREMRNLCMNQLSTVDITQAGLSSAFNRLLVDAASKICDQVAARNVPAVPTDINSVLSQMGVNPANARTLSNTVRNMTVGGTGAVPFNPDQGGTSTVDRLRNFFR